jgi:hypothetical protein
MYFLQQGRADVVIMGTVDASSKHGEHPAANVCQISGLEGQ